MTEMVERVARALASQRANPYGDWKPWVKFARAAIAAMREPTEAMVNAAYDSFDWGPPMVGPRDDAMPKPVWQTMIDEAMKE